MKTIEKLIFMLLLLSSAGLAQDYTGGKTGLSFLKISLDGRGAALGDAVVADENGVGASYWNPAGLVSAQSGVSLAHSRWLEDVRSEFIATRFSGFGGALALSLQVQTVDGIMVRGETPSDEPLATLSVYDLAFGLSYARALAENLDVGVTVKMLNERILTRTASGYAVDFGVRYRLPAFEKLRLAASVHNLGSMSALREENIALPALLRLGAALPEAYRRNDVAINLNVAVNRYFQENLSFAAGVEVAAKEQYFLRLGYQTGRDSQSISAGLGLYAGRYQLDYAYVPFAYNLGNTHRFTLGLAL